MSKKYIDIEVFDGDDDIKYVRHEDMLNLLEQIRIKQEEKNKEIERLQNIIKEVREYIEENTNSDSYIELTSGKITDIECCIVAFEDILEILDKENI